MGRLWMGRMFRTYCEVYVLTSLQSRYHAKVAGKSRTWMG